ncbi:hypothetical protein O1L55_01200 [Streptomyces albulus]|nr:hypothetical protein [Streptomyces noursei]
MADALLEFWQAGPDGGPAAGTPGSLRRDPATGALLGRDGAVFTGFGRVPTDAGGHYAVRTLPPAARPDAAPHLAVCVHARGLLERLFTRVYFAERTATRAADPLLAQLPAERARTLLARPDGPGRLRFDIRLRQPADGGTRRRCSLPSADRPTTQPPRPPPAAPAPAPPTHPRARRTRTTRRSPH